MANNSADASIRHNFNSYIMVQILEWSPTDILSYANTSNHAYLSIPAVLQQEVFSNAEFLRVGRKHIYMYISDPI